MSLRGNQFKSNSFKNEYGEKPGSRASSKEPKARFERMPSLNFQDERVLKIAGLFFLILSIYFLVAFTSYLFTWQEDYSYVIDANGGWSNLFKTMEELQQHNIPVTVQNWLGKFGALLSHQFIYEWFGVASFLFVFVFFVIGYRLLFKVKIFALEKTFGYSLFFLLFTSLTFGFLHSFILDSPHYLEGEIGYWTNKLLVAQIGVAGVGGLIAFLGLTILIIAYNIDFKFPERVRPVQEEEETIAETGNSFSDLHVSPERTAPIERPAPVVPVRENIERPDQVEFTLNDRLASERKKEQQNITLTPSRFEETEAEPEIVLPKSPIVNVMNAPIILSPAVEPIKELIFEEPKAEPQLTIEKTEEEKKSDDLVEQFGNYDPTLDLSSYVYPHLELLENYGSNKISVNADELEANKNKIVETLNHYNIEIDKIKATIGPTVTLYEIIPAPGVRISKIKNLEDDIALSLAALGIRIIAPMPGKGTIGIEVPNMHPEMVSMRSILNTEKFQKTDMDLPIALGKTISNEVYIADLSKMPHLLVAGATGQGKSVGINAILVSLLYKKHPSQLKFVLVDPKKVELTLFNKIERHFLAKLPGEADAIITDTKKVIHTLNSLCIEMDQRYDLLKDAQVRNLKEYNDKFIKRKLNPNNSHRFLPYIVLIVDEFADLMMTAGKEVETPIARLAQLARAVGIHLVLATQRPSVNIITGTIKANFPARLAFRVLSKIDSRTILDSGGADQLIGRGDMLLSTGNDLIRLQCAFVDTPEVDRISEFIGNQRGYAEAYQLPEYLDEAAESAKSDFDPNDRDSMFEDAARLIVMHQQGSTSLIQRKMKLGYNRAGRIIDQLEAFGIVGPFEGSKAREVLVLDEHELEQLLEGLKK
ncbi:S-DNA-T family DNA segregation ATPase FtsK/SpoIIIE [Pedobacter cryoconitis]|uniref:S-DNA-T family DNA segregation ATPase FtsK/SpoIIIE n=1 Tax=Pedobacter cryoconitis TaxID=188932 RepID=A0A7W8ZNR1_9SPHI|nr:DNA translocase FtsK [Pedobacter cryoconitis]MBB5637426.1 S-DNA-T family DNA segregation ATPase FtsK/SpoIIIE [Pedobacter cryoconitis]MBB6269854.1 S-DNA-T family DNA segregation ATPase FtsK/SpoIIIE [Pedobacter cryoconitis]